MTRIIAVGTVFGDDAVAHQLLETLAPRLRALDQDLETVYCQSPGTELLPCLESDRATILLDAVADSGPPGKLLRIEIEDLLARARPLSSHALSLAEVLRLAKSLGDLPRQLLILGISIDPERCLDRDTRERCGEALYREIEAQLSPD